MGQPGYHAPVMVAEVVDVFTSPEFPDDSGPAPWIVDATFGGGGHSRALRTAGFRVLAIDRDPDAADQVKEDPGLRFVAGNFADLATLLHRASSDDAALEHPAGVLFDLGVSSHQLDASQRGFSYHEDGPLDMRMGPDAPLTAGDVVNGWSVDELTSTIRRYGEERFARRIAEAIVAARPLERTTELAAVVASAVPAPARRRRHPARRTFQAIRIAVNGELAALESGLDAALDLVAFGGRVVVIAYHSLEDRIVKQRFRIASTGCVCPPELPECMCGRTAGYRLVTRRPIVPSAEEVQANPRSRSAKLRAVERTAP